MRRAVLLGVLIVAGAIGMAAKQATAPAQGTAPPPPPLLPSMMSSRTLISVL